MTLKDLLSQNLKEAMKDKDQLRMLVIRSIKSDIGYKEVELKRDLTDSEIEDVIVKMIKSRKDSCEQYEKGNRLDLAEIEKNEIKILETYLPKALTQEELLEIVKKFKEELNITSVKDMGKLMKAVSQEVGNKADGKTISSIVKQLLS